MSVERGQSPLNISEMTYHPEKKQEKISEGKKIIINFSLIQ